VIAFSNFRGSICRFTGNQMDRGDKKKKLVLGEATFDLRSYVCVRGLVRKIGKMIVWTEVLIKNEKV